MEGLGECVGAVGVLAPFLGSLGALFSGLQEMTRSGRETRGRGMVRKKGNPNRKNGKGKRTTCQETAACLARATPERIFRSV